MNLREVGHSLDFTNCSHFSHVHCRTFEIEKTYKCINKSCHNITGLFNCTKGICHDITGSFNCRFRARNKKFQCSAERGRFECAEMNSIVKCQDGKCLSADEPNGCVRKCLNLSTEKRNVVLLSGDDVS